MISNEAHKDDNDIVVEIVNIINDSQKLKTKDNRISGKKCVIKTCGHSNRLAKIENFFRLSVDSFEECCRNCYKR